MSPFLPSIHAVVEAIAAINSAVASGNPAATMMALKTSAAGIRSLTEECADAYTEKLEAARQDKVDSADGKGSEYMVGNGHAPARQDRKEGKVQME